MGRPSAREHLLDTAERLFAGHGLEGVSLRAINAEAGLSPAALHYHFGSKQSLVEALLERRMPRVMARRGELLDSLEAARDTPTARDVLGALVRPVAELLGELGQSGHRYVQLLYRLHVDDDLDHQYVIQRYPGGVGRLEPLLESALPDLPASLRQLRFRFAIDSMLSSLAQGPEVFGEGLDAYVSALLDFVTGALEAPVTPPETAPAMEGRS